jgi:hypothetical protein
LLNLHDHHVSKKDAHGIAYPILSLSVPQFRPSRIDLARSSSHAAPTMCSQKPSRAGRIDLAGSRHSAAEPRAAAAEELTRERKRWVRIEDGGRH